MADISGIEVLSVCTTIEHVEVNNTVTDVQLSVSYGGEWAIFDKDSGDEISLSELPISDYVRCEVAVDRLNQFMESATLTLLDDNNVIIIR